MEGFVIDGDLLKEYRHNEKLVVVPNGIKVIGDYAFAERSSIEKIILPEGITELGDSAFYGCRSLKEITLPDSLRKIGDCAFESCLDLAFLHIPEGVKTICRAAFFCSGLTEIDIPSSVSMIMSSAFGNEKKYKTSMLKVHYNGTKEEWDRIFISKDGNEALRKSEIIFDK